eukprot:gene20487-24594_t
MHVRRGGRIPFNKYLFGVAVGYILLALIWVRVPLWGVNTSMGLPMVITGFDKTFLSLTRLAHILAIAYVIIVKVMNPGDELDDTLLIASGIMAQFALAHYLEWLPSIGWGNARPALQQAQPAKSKLVIAGRPVNAAAMSSGMKSGAAKSAVS